MTAEHSYHTLHIQESKEKERITAIILELVSVQAIFLLGSSGSFTKTSTIFSTDTPATSCTSHYYLLLLIEKEEEHTLNAVQDKIENNLQHFIPSTAIVLSTAAFTAWLSKGHRFALDVVNKAEILYQNESFAFIAEPSINEVEQEGNKEQVFQQTRSKVEGFLASAELHKLRTEYKLASFMLHQAAEQALRTMLIINTGLKVNTHSIDKLLRYCSMFCPVLTKIFPKGNEKEKKLYTLINKAYIDTRYKEDYSISYEELNLLTEKVKAIQELFESCKPF